MQKTRLFAIILVTIGLIRAVGAAEIEWSQTINGHLVELIKSEQKGTSHFDLLIDQKPVFSDDLDQFIHAAQYSGGGRTYLLLEEQSGGNACESQFQALDITDIPPRASPRFGNCSINPKVSVVDGALHVVSQAYKSRDGVSVASERIIFRANKFHTQSKRD